MMSGNRAASLFVIAVALVFASVGAPSTTMAADSSVHRVQGQVVAVNVKDKPPVIVVKAMTAKKQELIVGATVQANASITRGKKPVTLADIKEGETVDLTYVKNPDGLVAQSIRVR
ncbi:MAG: hypothetical protein AB1555_18990 [Nitrospirota bacterium]